MIPTDQSQLFLNLIKHKETSRGRKLSALSTGIIGKLEDLEVGEAALFDERAGHRAVLIIKHLQVKDYNPSYSTKKYKLIRSYRFRKVFDIPTKTLFILRIA